MRKRGLQYLLCLLAVSLVLAGCGSSSNNDSAANTSSNALMSDQGANSDGSAEAPAAESANKNSLANEVAAADTAAAPVEQGGGGASPAVPVMGSGQGAEGPAGFAAADVAAGLNKKLIYRANLNMEVTDYGAAQTEVRNMITLAGGYIIEFSENVSEYEQGGTFVLKVPAAGFSSFLNNLEKVKHEQLQRSIQGQDVSEEYVDLESRLKAKQLMETQYIEFMKKATKSADLVAFANQLGEIQEHIEQIKGRMRYIDQNVSFSTVELRLYQTEKPVTAIQTKEQGPLGERASEALKGSMNALSAMFQWLVVFLAAALPILVVAAVIVAVVIWLRRVFRRQDQDHIERIRQGNALTRAIHNAKEEAPAAPPAAPVTDEAESDNKPK